MNYKVRIFIVALFLSVLLWFVNHLNHEFTVKVPFTIHYSGFSPSTGELLEKDSIVDVELTSKGFALIRFYFRKNHVVELSKADFTPVSRGDSILYILHPQDLIAIIGQSLPDGFLVAKAPEDTLMFSYVSYPSKEVPVKVPLSISCAEGYMLSGVVRISPEKVVLNGPIDLLRNIDTVVATSIYRNNVSDTIITEAPLESFSDLRIRSSLNKVRIIVPIEKSKLLLVTKPYNIENNNKKISGEVEITLIVPESINNVKMGLKSEIDENKVVFSAQVPEFINVMKIEPESIPLLP